MGLGFEMWDLADDLGLTVVEHHGEHTSGYYPGERFVRLTPGMPRRVSRSVLAHEIGHHVLGHQPTDIRVVRVRQEQSAQEWAARRLIAPRLYIEAERLREGHVPSIAFDLNVSDELVLVYQGMIGRRLARAA